MPPITDPAIARTFDFFVNSNAQADKISRLQTQPENMAAFQRNLVRFLRKRTTSQLPRIDHPTDRPTGVVERTMNKADLLNALDFFEQRHCLCLKICFGLDICLNPRFVASGSFFCPDGAPTLDRIDTVYSYEADNGQSRGSYLLDCTWPISPARALSLLNRYEHQAPLSDLHGYVLDIATYRTLLTDAAYLGPATQLRLRFGMNNTGDESETAQSGRAQIMMIEIAAADVADLPPFYLCSTSIQNDDETDCPPRQPCRPAQR